MLGNLTSKRGQPLDYALGPHQPSSLGGTSGTTMTYDANGNRGQKVIGTSETQTYTFNALDQLTGVVTTNSVNVTYTYL